MKRIVGAENATDREIILEAYMGTVTITMSVGMDKVPLMLREAAYEVERPGFVVRAGSREEVQQIVHLANQYKIPIIPMGAFTSTYYETVPSQGCIMLDLSRMRRIEIDEDIMTVTLELGVTWAQAYRDLAKKGYWVSNQASPASVSILGTTSQAGMHLPMNKHAVVFSTYYSDLTIGLEVVLPNGELLVTGSAALLGARPQSARAYGPNLGAIFLGAQGTLGIVVKQTLPLWRIPEEHVFVQGNFKYENFNGLVKAMHRIVDEQFKGPIWAEQIWAEQIWAIYDGTGKFGAWEFYVQIFGSKSFVKPLKKFATKTIVDEGGKIISKPRILEPETDYSPQMYEEMIYWRPRANAICTPPTDIISTGFSLGGVAAYDKLSELHEAALRLLAKHKVTKDRINRGMAWTLSRSGAIWYSLNYLYDKNDVEEVKRANAIREEWEPIRLQILGEKASLDVYFGMTSGMPYRLTPAAAKIGLPKLGEYYKIWVQLKRMLDPNRIMNPGKFMDIEPY